MSDPGGSSAPLDLRSIVARFGAAFSDLPMGLRKVGREAEYPVVGPDGAAFDISRLFDDLVRRDDFGPALTRQRAPDGMVVGLSGIGFSYATEVGTGTIEVITGPRHDLLQLARDHEAAIGRLVQACDRHGAMVLGLGAQPQTPPGEALMTAKRRYGMLLDRIGPDWLSFTTTASDQVHVDVAGPELVAMTNLGNILSPIFIALCGNSPVVGGEDAGVCSWREAGMGRIDAAHGRHGMPLHPLTSLHDHIERLVDLPHLLHKERGVPHPVSGSFRDFLTDHGQTDTESAFEAFLVHEHYVWHSARPRSRHGTVELRAACQQPWDSHMAPAALGLGIIAGGAEIGGYLEDVLGPAAWETMRRYHGEVVRHGLAAPEPVEDLIAGVLDRAKAALRGRSRREARLLDPLYRRLKARENPAQQARRVWSEGGVDALLAHARLPAAPD